MGGNSLTSSAFTAKQWGSNGERIAAGYLQKQNYRILCCNYHTRWGEIDIIAMSPDQLVVFVEVKHYKAGSMVSPLEAITRSKQRTICKVANQFLSRSPYRSLFSRIDIIVVCNHHVSQHIENAF